MVWLANQRRLSEVIERWQGVHVVVLGDALLDEWCYGEPERLSREAPAPVIAVQRIQRAPGGAANTAVNIAALGGKPTLIAGVGDDREGELLHHCLAEAGVDFRAVVVPGQRTPTKRRIVAADQIVVRLDGGKREALPPAASRALIEAAEAAIAAKPAAIAVCDYGYGGLDTRSRSWLRNRRETVPVVAVDAHRLAPWRTVRPTLVTPSFVEAAEVIGVRGPGVLGTDSAPQWFTPDTTDQAAVDQAAASQAAADPAATDQAVSDRVTEAAATDRAVADRAGIVQRYAQQVLDQTGAQVAAVTLDADGAVVIGRDGAHIRTTTLAAPASHAVGAGDVYLAALTLATAVRADLADAATLAQLAAQSSVGGPGTCICRAAQLSAELFIDAPELVAGRLTTVAEQVRAERARGARLVFTNGCFDVLHRGHVAFLRQARSLGDVLVVAVNSDASVRRLKGPDRPVNHVEDRAAVLAALSYVDHVVVFDEDSPARVIERLRPDVYVKGGDYRAELLPEAALVRDLGGEVRILDYVPDRSTSAIIERIRAAAVGKRS